MKFTYLLIDFFTVIVPLIFSFHPRISFYKNWPALFPAIILTGLIFIGWDMYFTSLKIWGFNSQYITGAYVGNLPVEEVLFFLCIPYSCLFTYMCLSVIIKKSISKRSEIIISSLLIAGSVFMAFRFIGNYYTSSAFTVLALLLFVAQFIIKVSWLSKFYVTYLWLLLPFLIVNGLLTGTGLEAPVVWYNPAHNLNLRILTIPVEDIFYGMDLILLNIIIYSWLCIKIDKKRKNINRVYNYTSSAYSKSNIH